jgi:hypothetical protein
MARSRTGGLIVPLILDRSHRVKVEHVGRERGAEDTGGEGPVVGGIVPWTARQQSVTKLRQVRLKQDRRHEECHRDQADEGATLLDDAKAARPEHDPGDESDGNRPPLKGDAGRQHQRDGGDTDR